MSKPGDIAVEFGSAAVDFDAGVGRKRLRAEFLVEIIVPGPSAAENQTVAIPDAAFEIVGARSVVRGQSSPSVTWNVRHGTDRSAAGSDVFDANPVTSSTTSSEQDDAIGFAKVDAGSSVWFVTTATAGSVDEIAVTLACRFRTD